MSCDGFFVMQEYFDRSMQPFPCIQRKKREAWEEACVTCNAMTMNVIHGLCITVFITILQTQFHDMYIYLEVVISLMKL